jgi:hypothetical protein
MFTLANLLHTYLYGKHKKDKKQHKSDSLRPIRLKYNDYPSLFTLYFLHCVCHPDAGAKVCAPTSCAHPLGYSLLFTSYLITSYFLQIVSWRLAKLGGKAFREIAG